MEITVVAPRMNCLRQLTQRQQRVARVKTELFGYVILRASPDSPGHCAPQLAPWQTVRFNRCIYGAAPCRS